MVDDTPAQAVAAVADAVTADVKPLAASEVRDVGMAKRLLQSTLSGLHGAVKDVEHVAELPFEAIEALLADARSLVTFLRTKL